MIDREVFGGTAIDAAGSVFHFPTLILEQCADLELPGLQALIQTGSDDERGFIVSWDASFDAIVSHCQVGIGPED